MKIHDISMLAIHVIYVTTEMIKSSQYIYNNDRTSYIKILFKVKAIPVPIMVCL